MRHVRIQITQPRTNDMSLFYLFFIDFFWFCYLLFTFIEKKNNNKQEDRKR